MAEINLLKEQPQNNPESESLESDISVSPDLTPEAANEQKENSAEMERVAKSEEAERQKVRFIPPKAAKKSLRAVRPPRDPIALKVEKILEEDLHEQYEKMSPIAQQEFKIRGEEITDQIREILKSAHVRVKKIFNLIADWLSLIPGVNRFFLEQEAKIKTDKILAIKKQNGD